MSGYNLRNIHWLEFEELCCEVLGAYLGVQVKHGKAGGDGGLDGIFVSKDGANVLQAKYYVGSGSKALINHLRSSEVKKAERISAERYFLMTSCELYPYERDEIVRIYHGLIKDIGDVFSGTDICELLKQYQWIARSHYNLWLSGIEQLETFCGDGTNSKSVAYLDGLEDDLRVAVKTEEYARACARLLNDKVIIITGQAGTGKTILAKQLIAEFVFTLNYKFVFSEYDLTAFDAQIERHPSEQMLLFIDDFLGANILDALRENRDSRIVNLIRRVRRSENLKLVLTSRSYIINEAVDRTPKFSEAKIASFEYRLDEKRLSRIDKARMLLTHVLYGNVTKAYKQSVSENDNFFKVIDHANFNPRIVAYCFVAERVNLVHPEVAGGIGKILWMLDNPSQIWKDCFDSLDELEKCIVIMVHLANSSRISLGNSVLLEAYRRMMASTTFARYRIAVFDDVMKRLCSSVVVRKVSSDETGVHITYSPFNPSVSDYILGAYNTNENLFVEAALFLEQADVVIQIARDASWQEKSHPQYAHLCKAVIKRIVGAVVENPTLYASDFVLKIFNEITEAYSHVREYRQVLAAKIVKYKVLQDIRASGDEVIKFLSTLHDEQVELYEGISIDKELLDKTIETAKDCETMLLLGDLYYYIDDVPPKSFYDVFRSNIDKWFDSIADWRGNRQYEDEQSAEEDVYEAALSDLNDHNIDPEILGLEELASKHDFSQFVAAEDAGSTWRDERAQRQMLKAEEDEIIRQMFRREMS